MDPYRRLSQREIYRNPWLVVEHHDVVHPTGFAGEHVAIVGQRPSGVVVLNENDEFLFTLQPRFAARQYMLEIVKGGAEEHETALAAAQRELLEELGFVAEHWDALGGVYELPSLMQHPVMLFLARHISQKNTDREATEDIVQRKIPRLHAVSMAISGEMADAVTCTAILRADVLIRSAS